MATSSNGAKREVRVWLSPVHISTSQGDFQLSSESEYGSSGNTSHCLESLGLISHFQIGAFLHKIQGLFKNFPGPVPSNSVT